MVDPLMGTTWLGWSPAVEKELRPLSRFVTGGLDGRLLTLAWPSSTVIKEWTQEVLWHALRSEARPMLIPRDTGHASQPLPSPSLADLLPERLSALRPQV